MLELLCDAHARDMRHAGPQGGAAELTAAAEEEEYNWMKLDSVGVGSEEAATFGGLLI